MSASSPHTQHFAATGVSSSSSPSRTYQYKLVLLGDSAVGKSSLVMRFVKKQFSEYQESTIGAAFLTQTIQLQDSIVKFEIWDTAGQERYHSLAPMYYRGASAAIVVYDVTSKATFLRAKSWIKEIQRQGNNNMIIALAGNKLDLITDQQQGNATTATTTTPSSDKPSPTASTSTPTTLRQVEFDEGRSYAEENGLLFFETSAKNGYNVNELFRTVAQKLPKTTTMSQQSQQQRDRALQLDMIEQDERKSCCG